MHRLRLPLWSLSLAAALWALSLAGTGDIATPPLLQPDTLGDWVDRVGMASGFVAILRLLAIMACWYLVVATIAGLVARRSATPAAARVSNRLTPAFVRRVLASGAGVTISAAGLTMAVSPLLVPGTTASAVAAPADGAPQVVPRAKLVGDDAETPATETARLEEVSLPTDPDDPRATLEEITFAFDVQERPSHHADAWPVEPGDHLWSIAEETLTDAWAAPPTDDQIAPYWLELIELNRSNLVDPNNADLLLPGQEISLAPTPPAPQSPATNPGTHRRTPDAVN